MRRLLRPLIVTLTLFGLALPAADAMTLREYYNSKDEAARDRERINGIQKAFDDINNYLTSTKDQKGQPKTAELMALHNKRAAILDRIYKGLNPSELSTYMQVMYTKRPDMQIVDAVKNYISAKVTAVEKYEAARAAQKP